jgi:hypothetical protein
MKNNRIYLIIGGVLLLLVVVAWLFSLRPKRYNWTETYKINQEQPYDLSLFKSVAEASFPNFDVVNYVREDEAFLTRTGATFFYIDDWGILDSLEASRLIEFMERGNTVFVSACNDHHLIQSLFAPCKNGESYLTKYLEADSLTPELSGKSEVPETSIYYRVVDKTEIHPWSYYSAFACGNLDFDTLGQFSTNGETYPDYLRIRVGKGELRIHATPLIFTNYHFKKPEIYGHISAILEDLPGESFHYYDPKSNLANAMSRPHIGESPLRFILSNPPLKWAWYITLALVLIYVLNNMRRKQRPIPVLNSPVNETATYLEMLSRLYRKDSKHKHLVGIKEQMLLNHLRQRYRLSQNQPDEQYFREASIRLQMDESYIRNFFKDLNRAKNNSTLSDQELIAINRRITEFYAQCP